MSETFKTVEFLRPWHTPWINRSIGDRSVFAGWFADVLIAQGEVKFLHNATQEELRVGARIIHRRLYQKARRRKRTIYA